ncbi:MAG TPA: biotin--[acetyl-CoA-carboxylase] ligase [Pseudomonadales bacterium]|nr:biotin--[acetyl-CoA-carboxylase] ligase [Pseudomonadales bacterium]
MASLLECTRFSIQDVRRRLETPAVGQHLYLLDQVESTNVSLRAIARAGGAEGTVLVAESQTHGRGRHGGPWFSPAGVNLYASVLFRPSFRPREAAPFSFVASLAMCDALRELGGEPGIKWPNDVLLGGRKVAGTLLECATRGHEIDYLLLGVGVNLNVEAGALRAALGESGLAATSVAEELGGTIDRSAFTASYLNHLGRWVSRHLASGPEAICAAWRTRDILTGRRVEVRGSHASFEGWARGVDTEGRLLVEAFCGGRRTVTSEEVRILD